MSRRERRSVSLGRNRERPPRDLSRGPEDDTSTRQNVSNFMLTLQRVQAVEEENRALRKENHMLRQRSRASRLSSASFSSGQNNSYISNGGSGQTTCTEEDFEDKIIAADVKRNSLLFVGDNPLHSPEHAALQAQYKKLQEDFETVKEFLKHLFHHALTMSNPSSTSTSLSSDGNHVTSKEFKDKDIDVNTFNPIHSKQLEHSLEDIHGQINRIRNSQDLQQVKMEQVQLALDNVLCQSSVRNDVTMRIVRQQDKMRELHRHSNYLESQLSGAMTELRQAQERIRLVLHTHRGLDSFIAENNRNLKGNTRNELGRISGKLHHLGNLESTYTRKMAAVKKTVDHMVTAANRGENLIDSKPSTDVIECMSKLERLIGSDWHRLGRVLGLSADCLDDIGKFTNFDLTTRAEKVIAAWAKSVKGGSVECLQLALMKMDRDVLLIADFPICKYCVQLPSEVMAFCVAHMVDVPSACHTLAWQGVIGPDTLSFVLGGQEEYRKASRLLHTIVFMGTSALLSLSSVLDSTNQSHLANKIRGCLQSDPSEDNRNSRLSYTATLTHSLSSDTPPASTKVNPKINNSTMNESSHQRKSKEKQQRQKRSRSLFARKSKSRDSETGGGQRDSIDVGFDDFYCPVSAV